MHFDPPSDSLAVCFPALAAEWHPTKNGALTPAHVTSGTSRKVWWQCRGNSAHVWQAKVANRAGVLRRGCPMCANRVLTPENSLRGRYPELARQWHPTANHPLTPDDVIAGCRVRVTWVCPVDSTHVWKAKLNNRTAGKTGCPMCANKKISPERSLLACRPELAAEWHPTKNGGLTPGRVFPASNRKVWWQCPRDPTHAWRAVVATRSLNGAGCPVCSGRVPSPTTSLRARRPDVAAEWHPTKNGKLSPDDVMCRTLRRVWWQCGRDPAHVWQTTVATRVKAKIGCSICAGLVAEPSASLRALFPRLAREWHPTKNGTLRPERVLPTRRRPVWWRCLRDPSHEWAATVYVRAMCGALCPSCAGGRGQATSQGRATRRGHAAAQAARASKLR